MITVGTGSDVLAYRYNDGHVDLWNAVDGTTTTLRMPAGQTLYNVFGTTVVSYQEVTAEDGTTGKLQHLLTAGPDGTTRDVPVGEVPTGMVLGGPVRGDAKGLVFFARLDGASRLVDVDQDTGQVRAWTAALPTASGYTYTKLSPGTSSCTAASRARRRTCTPAPTCRRHPPRSRSTAPAPGRRTTSRWSATGSSTVPAAARG